MSPNNTVNGFDADTFVFLNGSPLFLIREHRIRLCFPSIEQYKVQFEHWFWNWIHFLIHCLHFCTPLLRSMLNRNGKSFKKKCNLSAWHSQKRDKEKNRIVENKEYRCSNIINSIWVHSRKLENLRPYADVSIFFPPQNILVRSLGKIPLWDISRN